MYSPDQPLQVLDQYGVFPHWPQDGLNWIHPFDVPKVESMIPSHRVFLRTPFDEKYMLLHYGEISMRVMPSMWLTIDYEGFDIGDTVEVRSLFGRNEPYIGTIKEMLWNSNVGQIEYQLARAGRLERRRYTAGELQPAESLLLPPLATEPELNHKLFQKKEKTVQRLSASF
jgi:hypothetical protein